MRRPLTVAVGIAVLACAGCSGEAESAGDGPAATKATSTGSAAPPSAAPKPKPKPSPVALSVPMYQRAMTNVEKVLKPYALRVMNARTIPAFDAARAQLAAAVVLERKELAKITPPRGLRTAHPQVLDAFDAYAGNVTTELSEAGGTKTSCGLPRGTDVRLYEAKTGVRTAFVDLTQSVQKSVGRGVKFGALAVPGQPAKPAVIGGRGRNGDVFQRSGPRGSGTLEVTNSGDDIVIVVTASNPRKPMASMYVRANQTATLRGIRGDYWVYYKSGTNWDNKFHRFTEDCSYARLERRLTRNSIWSLTLETIAGNTDKTEVDAF